MQFAVAVYILLLSISFRHSKSFLLPPSPVRNVIETLGPTYIMTYGAWGSPQFCPAGMFAVGYQMKILIAWRFSGVDFNQIEIEGNQGGRDDTALNAIELTCAKLDGTELGQTITSSVGPWGGWDGTVRCPTIHGSHFFLTEFALQVEADQHGGDDTAANYVKFKCRDFQGTQPSKELAQTSGHGMYGVMGSWSKSCPPNSAICGIETRVEGDQHGGDDTALNDVAFFC